MARPNRVVVIGGGLTGLAAAHRIAQAPGRPGAPPTELVVLEAKDRVGGVIWTERRDGFTLEGGADSFITDKPWGIELCRALGLGDQLLGTATEHRRSFVVRGGRLLPVPEGFVLMAPTKLGPLLTTPVLSWRGKLRVLLDLFLPRRADEADESLAAFVRRRLGREALERLVQPLVAGIYTANPNELSLRATLPQFIAMEREHGGLIRGAWYRSRAERAATRHESGARYGLFVTLKDGMDTLPRALAAALPGGAVRTGVAARRVHRPDPRGPWRVELLDGPPLEADAVLIATEAHAAARLVDGVDAELALTLRSIPYASSAIVQLAYRRDQVRHPLDGFGAVVPSIEGRPLLAVSFASVKFPDRAPAGTVLLRAFVGGALQPESYELDDAATIDLARRELDQLLGARGEPLLAAVARHPRGMPQYTLGHLDRLARLRRQAGRHGGLFLAGNYLDGVGVPDCVRAGQLAADAILAALSAPANPVAA